MPIKKTLERYQASIQESIEMLNATDYRDLPDKTLREDLLIAQHALKAVDNVLSKVDEIEKPTESGTLNIIGMAIAQEFRQAIKEGLL